MLGEATFYAASCTAVTHIRQSCAPNKLQFGNLDSGRRPFSAFTTPKAHNR